MSRRARRPGPGCCCSCTPRSTRCSRRSVTSIGHTADPQGRGALAAALAEPESAPTAFAALAAAHPDAPLAAAYRARAGADGPAALTRSLVGAGTILGAVLVRLADADADDPDAP